MNRFLLSLAGIFLTGTAVISLFVFYGSDQKIPTGRTGIEAESLRKEIEQSIRLDDWNSMTAFEFTLEFNRNYHFIDRKRGLTEVQFYLNEDLYLVQFDRMGRAMALKNGEALLGDDLSDAYRQADSYHKTDLFWLNPFQFLRSNTEIQIVGSRALLVIFHDREDDTYLIVTDQNKRPTHWKMWSRKNPISGMETSFEDWKEIENRKALVSLKHQNQFQELVFKNVKGYGEYPGIQKDRFINFNQHSVKISED
ncbi:MAG: hypothetical protein OEZ34_03055 [Spirochaetia bacterium]|nr:hypothetical protein [Spirochaetia bacterium]